MTTEEGVANELRLQLLVKEEECKAAQYELGKAQNTIAQMRGDLDKQMTDYESQLANAGRRAIDVLEKMTDALRFQQQPCACRYDS